MSLIGIQFLWTIRTEHAIRNALTMSKIMKNTNAEFIQILNLLIDSTTKNLTKMERLKYETLITIHVHQRYEFSKNSRKTKSKIISMFYCLLTP